MLTSLLVLEGPWSSSRIQVGRGGPGRPHCSPQRLLPVLSARTAQEDVARLQRWAINELHSNGEVRAGLHCPREAASEVRIQTLSNNNFNKETNLQITTRI